MVGIGRALLEPKRQTNICAFVNEVKEQLIHVQSVVMKEEKVYVVKGSTNYTAIRILRLKGMVQGLFQNAKALDGD